MEMVNHVGLLMRETNSGKAGNLLTKQPATKHQNKG